MVEKKLDFKVQQLLQPTLNIRRKLFFIFRLERFSTRLSGFVICQSRLKSALPVTTVSPLLQSRLSGARPFPTASDAKPAKDQCKGALPKASIGALLHSLGKANLKINWEEDNFK